jgi:hypothetical protein
MKEKTMILTHVDYFRIWDVLKAHDVENNAVFFAGIGDDLYTIYSMGTRHKGAQCAFFLESTACHDCQEKHGASPQLTFADFDKQVTTQCAQGDIPAGDAFVMFDGTLYPIVSVELGCNGVEDDPKHHREHILLNVDYNPASYAEDNDEEEVLCLCPEPGERDFYVVQCCKCGTKAVACGTCLQEGRITSYGQCDGEQ